MAQSEKTGNQAISRNFRPA